MSDQKWYNSIIGNWFGFNKLEENEPVIHNTSFAEPENIDAAVVVETYPNSGGVQSFAYHIDPVIKNTKDQINQYRALSNVYECSRAVEEIVNDGIVCQADSDPLVKLILESTNLSDAVKQMIYKEFDYILRLYNFEYRAEDMFRSWYIDSRIAYHKIVDEKTGKLKELRRLDPRYLEKVRFVRKAQKNGAEVIVGYDEYFVYKPQPDDANASRYYLNRSPSYEIRIPPQAIVFSHSGLYDENGNIISYLHQSIKPINSLKALEEAALIYRIARAPERRVFYVDVGNLPKAKAEQYVKNVMSRFKNKIVFDSKTGKLRTNYDSQSILEDYWLPRKEGSKSTEVTTLPGGQNLGNIEDIKYFRDAAYSSLHVPVSRFDLERESQYSIGKPSEITREELRFSKFINKLQRKFSDVLLEPLKTQVVASKICTSEEWDAEANGIKIFFNTDSYYEELKEAEILQSRVDLALAMEPLVGRAFPLEYVLRHAFKMTDEEIKSTGDKILKEQRDGHPRYRKPDSY